VEVVDEYVCSDDECVTRDDEADSDVAEDEKEEVSESLDLFDSYVQGFVLRHSRQLLKRKKTNKKQMKAHKKQNESKTADERVLWLMP
jgi:DNA polymerase elongation subunit (family B)